MISANELIVDSFAGGGGASTAIRMAFGREPDIAINHDPEAIAMHEANHPNTKHYCQSIYQVDPNDITREHQKRIGLAWFSPDCTHHSKARGGKPKEKHIRDLAWVVVHWAERAVYKGERPRVIAVENVEEFQDWAPLLENGQPCPLQKGFEFQRWVKALRKLGYKVEWRELRAHDYGAKTIRKRLFVIARCDEEPIVWPAPTHGPGLLPYRTAAECIDWSLPCPSIFLSKEEGKAIRAKRPLADPTMRRIAHGVKKFVLDAHEPFIVNLTHQGGIRVESFSEPFKAITGANGGEKAVITPFIARTAHGDVGKNGKRRGKGQHPIDAPLGTPTASTDFAVAMPFITKFRTGSTGSAIDEPLHTITAGGKSARPAGAAHAMGLVAASVVRHYGASIGSAMHEPVGTVTSKNKTSVITAHIAQHNNHPDGAANPGRAADAPLSTITQSGSQQGVVSGHLVKLRGTCVHGQSLDDPAATISAQGQHIGIIAGSLLKCDKEGLRFLDDMEPQALTEYQIIRARKVADLMRDHGLWDEREFVTLEFDGFTWIIVDIGLRMLTPRELFNAQGFPPDYIIAPMFGGKPLTKTAQVRMCGNSVSPPPACAILEVNFCINQITHHEELQCKLP